MGIWVDVNAGRIKLREQWLAKHTGQSEPPEGWEEYLPTIIPKLDHTCGRCRKAVFEVQPFGEDGLPICQSCTEADPKAMAVAKSLYPNG